jgi:hypothetical protein
MVLRSVAGAAVEGIADNHFLRFFDDATEEIVVDGIRDEQTAGGDAVLALVEEDGAHRLSHRLIHVAVGEDDQRTLSSQLQRHLLDIALGAAEQCSIM